MATATKQINTNSLGSSLFYITFYALSTFTLIYFLLQGFVVTRNIGVIVAAIIFAIFLLLSVQIARKEIFNSGSWTKNSIGFTVGFLIWAVLGTFFGTQSVLFIAENNLFSTISSELPLFIDFIMNVLVIPISEEFVWMFALPLVLFTGMDLMGKNKQLTFFANKWIQLIVVILISGLTFAFFHTGKVFTSFIIAAFVFRAALILFVQGDEKLDLIPFVDVLPAFAIGAHIGNNWVQFGIMRGLQIITGDVIGWIYLLLLVAVGLTFINWAALKVLGRSES